MRNIKLIIQYDGTNYCGWQKQKNGVSVQDLIEKALKKILHEKILLIGAARTDSGVHARGQCANFITSSKLPLKKIRNALNANLPPDISVSSVSKAKDDFHAQRSAKRKLYRFSFWNRPERSPFFGRYSAHIPYKIDIEAMKKSAKLLSGKHDFLSFKGAKGATKTSTRHIKKLSVTREGGFVIIDMEGDGFLYNMARNIAGTLLEAGRGKFKPCHMPKILSGRNRNLAGPTAPAKGLTLIRVKY